MVQDYTDVNLPWEQGMTGFRPLPRMAKLCRGVQSLQ